MKRDDPDGIDERAYRFFCDVVAFVETVPIGPTTSRIIGQLVDAAGSIGSNREEALSRSSNREIIHYNEVSLRGASESVRLAARLRRTSARVAGKVRAAR